MKRREESGLIFSFWLGPVTLEMSPLRAEHGRGTGLERMMLYGGHVELELSMGLEGQQMCSLGQVTQSLWDSVFVLFL